MKNKWSLAILSVIYIRQTAKLFRSKSFLKFDKLTVWRMEKLFFQGFVKSQQLHKHRNYFSSSSCRFIKADSILLWGRQSSAFEREYQPDTMSAMPAQTPWHLQGRLESLLQAACVPGRSGSGLPIHHCAGLWLHHHRLCIYTRYQRVPSQLAHGRLGLGWPAGYGSVHQSPQSLWPDQNRHDLQLPASVLFAVVRVLCICPRQPYGSQHVQWV